MLSNLILSVNIVLPLLLVMAAGYGVRRIGLMDDKAVSQLNNTVFRIFLPIMLINNIRGSRFEELDGLSAIAFAMAVLLILFALLMAVVPRVIQRNDRRGVIVQALFRSNYAIFGMAVLANLYPGERLTIPSLMIPVTVPVYNILAVVCLEAFRGGRVKPRELVGKIARNQLVLACLLGIALMLLGDPLPTFLDATLEDLGGVTTTMALFTLGASFRFESLRGNGRLLAATTAMKLAVTPLIVLTLGALIGYRGQALGSLLIAFGGPIAVSSFTMAKQMGGDGDLAAQLVVSTTLFSVLTMFLFIFAMKTMGLL